MRLNDTALMRAYRATDDCVAAAPLAVLRPGEDAPGTLALLRRLDVVRGAVIAGWNPFSALRGDNEAANRRLQGAIGAEQCRALHAFGVPRAGTWQPEPGFLVLDCTGDAARRLACGARQNAYLWIARGGVPEVRLTVPGLLVAATRTRGAAEADDLACLTEEPDGTLMLSLRRYPAIGTHGLWYRATTPQGGGGETVTDVKYAGTSVGTVFGGPMETVADVEPVRVDPSDLRLAAGWSWNLRWEEGADRLRHVLTGAPGAE